MWRLETARFQDVARVMTETETMPLDLAPAEVTPAGPSRLNSKPVEPQMRAPLSRFFRKRASLEDEALIPMGDKPAPNASAVGDKAALLQQQETQTHEFCMESDEESSSEEEESSDEEEEEEKTDTARTSSRTWEDNSAQQNYSLPQDDPAWRLVGKKLEGHGSSRPQDEPPENPVKQFLRKMREKGSDLSKMKVATEATKDDKTVMEKVGHVVAVALVPELYGDDEDQQNTLGYYRTVRRETDEEMEKRQLKAGGWKGLAAYWKKEAQKYKLQAAKVEKKYKARVVKLENNLQTAEMEATCWKERAHEQRKELRELRGGEDSSVEPDEDGGEVENDLDDKEESVLVDSKEGILVDTNIQSDPVEFDPLATIGSRHGDSTSEALKKNDSKEELLVDTTAGPLATTGSGHGDSTSKEGDKNDAKEEILVDTSVDPLATAGTKNTLNEKEDEEEGEELLVDTSGK